MKRPKGKPYAEIREIVDQVKYKNWIFVLSRLGGPDSDIFLWIDSADLGDQRKSRKWRISPHMTRSEIVQTAFKCVLTAEEHECREQFQFKGRAVFGPHIDVDMLWAMCQHVDVRKEPA